MVIVKKEPSLVPPSRERPDLLEVRWNDRINDGDDHMRANKLLCETMEENRGGVNVNVKLYFFPKKMSIF